MELAVLGPVLIDGTPPPGAKERALLARLLVTPGVPVAATDLVEAAWADPRPGGVMRSLHVRLAKLRALLGPDRSPGATGSLLVREPAGYRLTVAPESIDAHRFIRLLDEATALGPADALEVCDAAVGLWRGEPFADIEHADATVHVERRRLEAAHERARHVRAGVLRDLGRPAEAADELDRLVSEDPLREALVRDLMLAHYDAGRHAEALRAYRDLAARLADVGLQPGPEVRELESMILRHPGELTGRRPAAPSIRHRTNIGVRVAGVLGREDEVDAARRALAEVAQAA